MRKDVHTRRVHPHEEWLISLYLAAHVINRGGGSLVVDCFHPLAVERAGILNRLLTDAAPVRLFGRIVLVGRLAAEHAARRVVIDILLVVFRPIRSLQLLFGIEVIKIAKKLVEAMNRWQIFIAVAEMVLTELAGCVTERLERLGYCDVTGLKSNRRARMPTLVRPVRFGVCPVMKDERPAVQLFSA